MILSLALAALCAQDSSGFDHFYNLEYDEALAALERELIANPESPGVHNRIAQTIVFREMYRTGALESELVSRSNPFLRRDKLKPSDEDRKRFDNAVATAMWLADGTLKENPRDVQALYAMGVAYGLRANYNFLVRKAWLDALRDAGNARKFHSRASQIDPGFVDALLIQGIYDYVAGSLPLSWRMLGFLAGFHGDRERGIRTLKIVAEREVTNSVDAQVFLAVIYRRERRAREAVPLLEKLIHRFPRNYLFRLELAYMFADLGERPKALATLDRIEELHRAGAPGYSRVHPAKLNFARGNMLFWFDDFDRALVELKDATAHAAELDLNSAILAWLRLGQTYDLKGERKEAVAAYQEAVKLAPDSEAGKEAARHIGGRYKR